MVERRRETERKRERENERGKSRKYQTPETLRQQVQRDKVMKSLTIQGRQIMQ